MSKPAAPAATPAQGARPLRARAGSERPEEELAARLLSSAEPYRATSGERRRVWQQLAAEGSAAHVGARRWLLSPVVVAALLLSLMTVASATVGRRLIERALHLGASQPPTRGAPAHEAGRSGPATTTGEEPAALAATAPPALPPREPSPGVATAPGPSSARVAEQAVAVAARAAVAQPPARPSVSPRTPGIEAPATLATAAAAVELAAPSAPPPITPPITLPTTPTETAQPQTASRPAAPLATAASAEEDDAPGVRPSPAPSRLPEPSAALREAARSNPEVRLVYDAALATRQGDPARGLRLVEEYLRRFPDGGYADFALVYGIDAANRLGDVDGAARLGARYLRQFPAGRFREEARRAVARATPAP